MIDMKGILEENKRLLSLLEKKEERIRELEKQNNQVENERSRLSSLLIKARSKIIEIRTIAIYAVRESFEEESKDLLPPINTTGGQGSGPI